MGLSQGESACPWPRGVEAPDPGMIREASLADVVEVGFPLPPENYPLVWERGDRVTLRPILQVEARAAVLNVVVLSAVHGAPPPLTTWWIESNGLRDAVTGPEWAFLTEQTGPADLYSLHIEALWALAWVLGVADELDPTQYCGSGLAAWLPDVGTEETFEAWRSRNMVNPRPAEEVAALLDLHYCLDWAHVDALMTGAPHPGSTLPYVVGQRRWALEWAVVFTGPYHSPPPAWDEVDLSS